MAWGRLESSFYNDYKFHRLAQALGIEPLTARGIAASIWSWCYDRCPDGDLAGVGDEELAFAIGWDPARGTELIEALVAVGLIEQDRKLHRFYERNDSYREAQRKRESRASRTRPGQSGTIGGQSGNVRPDRTGQDRTGQEREEDRASKQRPPTETTEPPKLPPPKLSVDERELYQRTEQLAARPPTHRERKLIRDLAPHAPTEAEWQEAYAEAQTGVGRYPQPSKVLFKLVDVVGKRAKTQTKHRKVIQLREAQEALDRCNTVSVLLNRHVVIGHELEALVRELRPDLGCVRDALEAAPPSTREAAEVLIRRCAV